MCTASHSVVCQDDGLYSVLVSPTSLRPLSCPALGPRVIDRPRDSGFGGCCAASLLLLQRNRVAPLRSAHHRELSPRLDLILVRRNRDFCRGKPAAGIRRIAPQNLIDQSHHGKEETKGDKKREIKRARVSQSKHASCRQSSNGETDRLITGKVVFFQTAFRKVVFFQTAFRKRHKGYG